MICTAPRLAIRLGAVAAAVVGSLSVPVAVGSADSPGTVVNVTPSTNLGSPQNVTVSGSGFHANALVDIYECHVIEPPVSPPVTPTENCSAEPLASAVATDAAGNLPARAVTVSRTFTSAGGGTENCAAVYGCNIFVVETNQSTARNAHGTITFGGRAPGDYDGDGDTDIAVFRPSSSVWFVQNGPTAAWGTANDIPVPGDYDGDGDTDIAVFRPSSGVWFVQGGVTVAWGTNGDIPVPGDYNGDGRTDIAVFRPSTGTWFVKDGITVAWGANGDIPVPGDYDGNGTTDIAVFRPSTGTWFVKDGITVAWGTNGDIPVPGDYDGNGTTDIAVFRPSTGTWFVRNGVTTAWGTNGDIPLPLPYAIRRTF